MQFAFGSLFQRVSGCSGWAFLAGEEAASGTFDVQLLLCFRAGQCLGRKTFCLCLFSTWCAWSPAVGLCWEGHCPACACPSVPRHIPRYILNSKLDEGLCSQHCFTEHFPVSLPNALSQDFLAAAWTWNRLNQGNPAGVNWRVQELINEIVQIYQ